MNILLSGSSGWLGRFLAPRLRAAGHCVIGLDVVQGADTTVVGSVADRAVIDQTFCDYDVQVVIHAAALHKPDIIRYPASTFVDVNVSGTLNLLEAAAAAGHDRFVFTSTTSVMVSEQVRAGKQGGATQAFWMNEEFGPVRPRNIYGVTKYAAEHLCRLYAAQHNLDIAVLRTGRFFPEDDDTHRFPTGPNLKANEFLNRRLTVEDVADAHLAALNHISGHGCRTYILSAPPPFCPDDARDLISDAPTVIARCFPDVRNLYDKRKWILPQHIDRVYDSSRAERELQFRPRVDFGTILHALESDAPVPFHHDPAYTSPKETR